MQSIQSTPKTAYAAEICVTEGHLGSDELNELEKSVFRLLDEEGTLIMPLKSPLSHITSNTFGTYVVGDVAVTVEVEKRLQQRQGREWYEGVGGNIKIFLGSETSEVTELAERLKGLDKCFRYAKIPLSEPEDSDSIHYSSHHSFPSALERDGLS